MKTKSQRFKLSRQLVAIAGFSCLMWGFQNCSKASFSSESSNTANGIDGRSTGTNGNNGNSGNPGTDPNYNNLDTPNTNSNSCYTYLHQTTDNIRILFMVDQSGSNVGQDGGTPTDPQKTVRGGSLQTFFDDYSTKSSFAWGLTTFHDNGAYPVIQGAQNNPIFSSQTTTVQSAINHFMSSSDSGYTPYQAALNSVIQSIHDDASAPVGTRYIIVFLSDGVPNPMVADATLKADVDSIMATHPGLVSFNTIYYGQRDDNAAARLQMMATEGGGFFLDTNLNPTNQDFLISNVITVPGTNCVP